MPGVGARRAGDEMAQGYRVEIRGLKELLKRLDAAPKTVKKHMVKAMGKSVAVIEGEIKPLTLVGVSGNLRNSISGKVKEPGGRVKGIVGIGAPLSVRAVYPSVMEFGRKPGPVPPGNLERWVHLKLRVPTQKAAGVAFMVARSIARKGIKGKFMFKKGWAASERRVKGFFDKAVEDVVDDLGQT